MATEITLDEDVARAWLADAIESSTAHAEGEVPNDLPDFDLYGDFRAGTYDAKSDVIDLVYHAFHREGSPVAMGLDGRDIWLYVEFDDEGGGIYSWALNVPYGGAVPLTVTGPAHEWKHLGDSEAAPGVESALSVLREAVQEANALQEQLDQYVASVSTATVVAVRNPKRGA